MPKAASRPSPDDISGERARSGLDATFTGFEFVTPRGLALRYRPVVDLLERKTFAFEAIVRPNLIGTSRTPELVAHDERWDTYGRLGRVIRQCAIEASDGANVFIAVHPEELESPWLLRPDDPMLTHDRDVFLVVVAPGAPHVPLQDAALRELGNRAGVHLVLHGFGTGWANLDRLLELRPTMVTLDAHLLRRTTGSRKGRAVLGQLVSLLVELGAEPIAQGIEHREQLDMLLEAGIHLGQGPLFGLPAFPPPPVTWPA